MSACATDDKGEWDASGVQRSKGSSLTRQRGASRLHGKTHRQPVTAVAEGPGL